jgi:hypothetical protein
MPDRTAAARKPRAGLGNMEDVFAGKDDSIAALADPATQAGRSRSAPAPAKVVPEPEADDDREPLITTVRIPGYLAENIRKWLYEHPTHTQHTMIFAGLAKLGIEVREDDLEPKRRPRSSRHR